MERWNGQPHVIAARGDNADIDWNAELSRDVAWQEFLIGEHAGRPVGVVTIIDPAEEETHYWGDVGPNLRAIDIWIGEERDLGRGYGTEMMQAALGRCFDVAEVDAVLIDPLTANIRARKFYRRLGFRFVERRRFSNDDCCVYRFDRPAREKPAAV